MEHYQSYYNIMAAAMVRGSLEQQKNTSHLFQKKLEDLNPEEINELILIGLRKNMSLDVLKRRIDSPEITKVMGFLRGIQPDNLLDISEPQGSFIWRVMDEFRFLPATVVDIDSQYAELAKFMHKGGVTNIRGQQTPLTDMSCFSNEQFDVVTLLDVLQHVQEGEKILLEICRITKRFVICVVPLKPDPQHKSAFTEHSLRAIFKKKDIHQFKVEVIRNSLVMVARK
ncbi:MAG: methyltransferase domain-containing protein [Cytophagales bacterium]|nr:MAG: methyltransferase domain-containing protein [Cytophagales bacterium]TAF60827.1 MAG: methyltransferase domain-containing protein [Cytophagales bacterium]